MQTNATPTSHNRRHALYEEINGAGVNPAGRQVRFSEFVEVKQLAAAVHEHSQAMHANIATLMQHTRIIGEQATIPSNSTQINIERAERAEARALNSGKEVV